MAKRKAKKKRKPRTRGVNVTQEPTKKMGRPMVQIDWDEFDDLCQFHCTLEEIAGWYRCDVKTIENACKREKGETFSSYADKKRGVGRASLRRVQWQKALAGDKTMLIWMGKQHLGQSDQQKVSQDIKSQVTVDDKRNSLRGLLDDREAVSALKTLAKKMGDSGG
jgi:hypothetical protein